MSQPTNSTASTGTGTSVEDLQGLANELTLETAISIDTEKVGSGNGNAWVKCGDPHTLASLVQIGYICNTNLHMPAPKTRGRTPRRAPATPTKGAKDKSSPPRFPIDQLEYVIIQNIDKIKGILPEDVQKEKLESYAKEWEVVKLEIGESRGAKTPCPKKISKEDKLIKGALLSRRCAGCIRNLPTCVRAFPTQTQSGELHQQRSRDAPEEARGAPGEARGA